MPSLSKEDPFDEPETIAPWPAECLSRSPPEPITVSPVPTPYPLAISTRELGMSLELYPPMVPVDRHAYIVYYPEDAVIDGGEPVL